LDVAACTCLRETRVSRFAPPRHPQKSFTTNFRHVNGYGQQKVLQQKEREEMWAGFTFVPPASPVPAAAPAMPVAFCRWPSATSGRGSETGKRPREARAAAAVGSQRGASAQDTQNSSGEARARVRSGALASERRRRVGGVRCGEVARAVNAR